MSLELDPDTADVIATAPEVPVVATARPFGKKRPTGPLPPGTLNFMRQFRSGAESRYVGTALRVGRSTGVGEAQAVGPGGEVAIIARLTAYR